MLGWSILIESWGQQKNKQTNKQPKLGIFLGCVVAELCFYVFLCIMSFGSFTLCQVEKLIDTVQMLFICFQVLVILCAALPSFCLFFLFARIMCFLGLHILLFSVLILAVCLDWNRRDNRREESKSLPIVYKSLL